MARTRNQGASLGRMLDTASQPLYILDEDRGIVFLNAACRRWLGAVADELVGRRCAYHGSPEAKGVDALAAGLCPPPSAFAGKIGSGIVTRGDGDELRRRRARFLPLGDVAELIAVAVVVDDLDLPDEAESAAETVEPELSEAERLHEQLRRFRHDMAEGYSLDRLVGTSPATVRARARVALAAGSRAAVAVYGPEGSGRRHLAKTIHAAASRTEPGGLIPLDCSVLGGDLVRSTVIALAAQDAESEHPGCNTLLLGDVESIPREMQAELAEVFFGRPFPLRLMATSAESLATAADRGDLHKRFALGLGTIEIELPPLVRRREDLPLLSQVFVEEINALGDKQVGGLATETLDMLALHEWPGDVAELAAAVAEAHGRAEGAEILPADLPKSVRVAVEASARPPRREVAIQLDDYLAAIERELIERAMVQAKGNKTKAAALLGLNRPRLYRRLLQLGLIEEEQIVFEPD